MVIMLDKPRAKVQREPRRQANKQPAWITVDNGLTKRECFVFDVSPGGAKIMTEAAIDVTDRFQPCEVVWRRGNIYGIKFLT
jgi:hypothetical protein